MKKFILLLMLALATSCAKDETKVINNSNRVSDLERRLALNETLDAQQSALIDLNSQAIASMGPRIDDLELRANAFEGALATEISLREAGDDTLDGKISTIQGLLAVQAIIDIGLQFQISIINSKINTINGKITTLQSRVTHAENDIDDLEDEVSALTDEVNDLRDDLNYSNGQISDLYLVASGLEDRIEALELTDPVPGPQGPQGLPGSIGPQGVQGPQGVPGINGTNGVSASLTTISLSGSPSCKSIGDGFYAKRDSDKVSLYGSLNDCNDNDDRIARLDPTPQTGDHAAYWITSTKLALPDGSSSANLKILGF